MPDREPMVEQLTDGPASIGTFFKSKSPSLAESLGNSPLDFLLVDRQHTAVGIETVESINRAAAHSGLPVMVRLATTDFDFVNTILDTGTRSLMIPQVEDPETVREVLDAARYDGSRSLSMGTRAGAYGARDREEYFDWVYNGLGIVPQIESGRAVDAADELADLSGVTALMIGATDLALSLGVSKDDEELQTAVDRVVDACWAADCGVGIFASSPAELARYRERMNYVVYSSNAGLLTAALERSIDR